MGIVWQNFAMFTREDWVGYATEFLEDRQGIVGAEEGESLVNYVDGFRPVYVEPGTRREGETWYVWFVSLGVGKSERVVNGVAGGVYLDAQSDEVYEHDPAWVLVLGTVTRIGSQPLLSMEMLREANETNRDAGL